ncbi:cache domain-containing protein [Geopsychrobacter electrodiphilus]|uniref:cache domain-containing protein n=1 Tax=Geopsychrobacter electrodiphilus TaxID=225196 RepID=UPI0003716D12|nr:cache domain-containing protein [Geopsychrobacter electrodiphilus]
MARKNQRLILTISLLLVVGFLLTSLASFFVSRASLRQQITQSTLPLTSDTIYSEIQRDLLKPIFISSLMAQDTFLRDWVLAGEKAPTAMTRYLKEIQERYQTETSFFISEKTGTYYQAKGILKHISPDNKRDAWYFRVRNMAADYEVNIDQDMANLDTMTVFINYKVFDFSGKFIGATGVGLTVNSVKTLLDSYQQKYGREVYFIDRKGAVTLHSDNFPEGITTLSMKPGISSLKDAILTSENGVFSFQNQGSRVHLNSRFIPEFNWYLLVEQNEDAALSSIYKTLVINLLICAALTAIVLFLTHLTIKSYQSRIETLRGIVPICAFCKKVRDDQGYWNQVEAYIEKHSEAEFSHSYCPDCVDKNFPQYADKINKRS